MELATTGKINHRMQVPFKDRNEAVELLKAAHAQLEQALTKMDDKSWDSTKGTFAVGGKVFYEMPYRDLAWMLFFDSVHHRGATEHVSPADGRQGPLDLRTLRRRSRRPLSGRLPCRQQGP